MYTYIYMYTFITNFKFIRGKGGKKKFEKQTKFDMRCQ